MRSTGMECARALYGIFRDPKRQILTLQPGVTFQVRSLRPTQSPHRPILRSHHSREQPCLEILQRS